MMENNEIGASETPQFDEGICERYLFGELTEAEQEKFETAYFSDDAFFDKFMAVKTELLDLCSRGELEPGKRAKLEPHFLATAPRARRLAESKEFIRALTAISDRDRPVKLTAVADPMPSLRDSLARILTLPRLAAAVVLFAAVGSVFIFWLTRKDVDRAFQQQPSVNTTEPQAAGEIPSSSNSNVNGAPTRPEVTINTSPTETNVSLPPVGRRPENASIEARKRSRSLPNIRRAVSPIPPRDDRTPDLDMTIATVGRDDIEAPTVELRRGSTRDIGEDNTLSLRADGKDRSAIISLYFKSDAYQKYVVTIETVAGLRVSRRVFDKRAVTYSGDGTKRIEVLITDTTRLSSKDYIVTLEGRSEEGRSETIEEYYFHVKRTPEEGATPEVKNP